MEVHFQCTIQICRYQCPDQCASDQAQYNAAPQSPKEPDAYGAPKAPPGKPALMPAYIVTIFSQHCLFPVPVDSYGSPQSAPLGSYNGPAKRTRREAEAVELDMVQDVEPIEKKIMVCISDAFSSFSSPTIELKIKLVKPQGS